MERQIVCQNGGLWNGFGTVDCPISAHLSDRASMAIARLFVCHPYATLWSGNACTGSMERPPERSGVCEQRLVRACAPLSPEKLCSLERIEAASATKREKVGALERVFCYFAQEEQKCDASERIFECKNGGLLRGTYPLHIIY